MEGPRCPKAPPAMPESAARPTSPRCPRPLAASPCGPVLEVSEDGLITFFDEEEVWEI